MRDQIKAQRKRALAEANKAYAAYRSADTESEKELHKQRHQYFLTVHAAIINEIKAN